MVSPALRIGRLEHEHRIDHIAAHVGHHLQEHVVALVLVFDQGILLAITTQSDGFAQGIHRLQMFTPEGIDLLKDEETLRFPHQTGRCCSIWPSFRS